MTKLYITEFTGMQTAAAVGHAQESAPVAKLPSIGTAGITPSGTSQQSAAINAATTIVRLKAKVACHVLVGLNPVATTNDMPLDVGDVEYFGVKPGDKIAVIAA